TLHDTARPDAPAVPARRTSLPPRTGGHDAHPEQQRNLARIRQEDVLRIVGAAVAALGATAWLFTQVLPIEGGLPFVLIA
ncbi:hypothetical protein, partial [Klebsiella pneumoniae]|uniref:hypothetical protein n=1 Tax=Klebsiella pneumoniae TaxID=573 RepID=UPI003853F64F